MPRILVVEDSAAMRAYVRASLESSTPRAPGTPAGPLDELEVVEAASGFDALRLLPRGRYDLVITDINMPDINGLELIKFVRSNELYRGVAVMIISTQSSERDRERGLALGANAFLAKPFTPEALREAVASSLVASATSATPGGPRRGEG
jgi:two-component system chemotaxis response regulator CheY